MEKVVVTGSAGFIGSHLCEALLKKGYAVSGIDNFDPFYKKEYKLHNLAVNKNHPSFTFFEADLSKETSFESIFEGAIAVIHLAGKTGVRPSIEHPQAYIDHNITATRTVLDVMRHTGISKLIFASSSSVYGNDPHTPWRESLDVSGPISPYAASKKACELFNHTYHHLYQMDILNLRFFTVFGPRQRPDLAIHKFIKMLFRGETIPMFGDGSTARDYTYVDDTVAGIMNALEYLLKRDVVFDTINLGNNHPVKLMDLILAIGKAMNIAPRIEKLAMQPGDVNITCAAIDKAQHMFAYQPKTTLEAGLQQTINWFKHHPEMLKL